MIRSSRLAAILAAAMMTAFTFAPIGTSSMARNTLYPAQAMSSPLAATFAHAVALVRNVLRALS